MIDAVVDAVVVRTLRIVSRDMYICNIQRYTVRIIPFFSPSRLDLEPKPAAKERRRGGRGGGCCLPAPGSGPRGCPWGRMAPDRTRRIRTGLALPAAFAVLLAFASSPCEALLYPTTDCPKVLNVPNVSGPKQVCKHRKYVEWSDVAIAVYKPADVKRLTAAARKKGIKEILVMEDINENGYPMLEKHLIGENHFIVYASRPVGVSQAFNKLVKMANSDYVVLLIGGHEKQLEETLGTVLKHFQKNSKLAYVGTGAVLDARDGTRVPEGSFELADAALFGGPAVVRREAFINAGMFYRHPSPACLQMNALDLSYRLRLIGHEVGAASLRTNKAEWTDEFLRMDNLEPASLKKHNCTFRVGAKEDFNFKGVSPEMTRAPALTPSHTRTLAPIQPHLHVHGTLPALATDPGRPLSCSFFLLPPPTFPSFLPLWAALKNKKKGKCVSQTAMGIDDSARSSFVLQYFKRRKNIQQVEKSFKAYRDKVEFIVNDDSRSEYADWVKALSTGWEGYLVYAQDIHEIRGYNRLTKFADGEFVTFLQDDDKGPKKQDWLTKVEALFQSWPDMALLGGFRGRLDYGSIMDKQTNLLHGYKFGVPSESSRCCKPIPYKDPKTGINFMFIYKVRKRREERGERREGVARYDALPSSSSSTLLTACLLKCL